MPERAALVTALILDRPTCIRCIAMKGSMSIQAVETTIARIEAVLALHRAEGRCRACGETETVIFVDRPVV